MGTPENKAAELQEVFDHANECWWILQDHCGDAMTPEEISKYPGRTGLVNFHPPKGRVVLSLMKHCDEGTDAIFHHWREFASLHEHPVVFAGRPALSYHHLVFHLANIVLHAVCNALDPEFRGSYDEFDWSALDPDQAVPEAEKPLAFLDMQTLGVKPPDIDDYEWLRLAMEQERAKLPKTIAVPDTPAEKRNKWIYDECVKGKPFGVITRELTRRIATDPECSEWEPIESPSGIKGAADRHAHRHDFSPPKSRQPGRREKK